MTTRSIQTVISFSAAFTVPGLDESQPAGNYRIVYDEALIDGMSRLAWQRTGAFIYLPRLGSPTGKQRMVPILPQDLDAAIEKDKSAS